MNSVSQDIIEQGFAAQLSVGGKTIWTGDPAWERNEAMFEEASELDPDFPLGKDIREAKRIRLSNPGDSFRPGVAVHVGESPLHPESRWSIIPGSRNFDAITNQVTYIVQRKVVAPAKTMPEPPDVDNSNPSPNDGYEALEDVGVATLSFEDSLAVIGFDIENTTTLASVSFPNLISCDPDNTQQGLMYFGANTALTSLDLPAFTLSARFFIASNPLLASVNLPLFVRPTDATTNFQIYNNTSLVSLSLPSFVPTLDTVYNFSNNALDAASINGLLARFVASASFVAGTIHMEGGGNVAPTGQGILDLAELIGRGVSVSTT